MTRNRNIILTGLAPAIGLGWALLDQNLTSLQIIGALVVLGAVWTGQHADRSETDFTSLKPTKSRRASAIQS